MIRSIITGIALLLSSFVLAQKAISTQYHGWYMYFGNHKLTDRFSLHTEYQWRRADWITTWQQSLLRVGLDYKLTDAATVTAGYAHILTWPYGEQPLPEKFLEHRLWEQFILTQKVGRFYFNHRYRLEQRWLKGNGDATSDDFVYRNRIRYRFLINYPLGKKEMGPDTFFLSTYDEVFIQFGPNFARNYLDQNRFYAALGYQYSSKGNIQLGYMNQFIIKGDGLKAERNHTLQVSVTYNADFRKKS